MDTDTQAQIDALIHAKKVVNTTVYNTSDVMAYVMCFYKPGEYKEFKIRYANYPRKLGWGEHARDLVVRIERDWRKNRVEIAILRYNKLANQSPILALAQASNDETFAPTRLRADLIDALDDSAYSRDGKTRASKLKHEIRVADKADKKAVQRNAILNLRKRVEGKKGTLRGEHSRLREMKRTLAHLKEQIPKWENEVIPAEEKELAKMEARLKKREAAAKKAGIDI